MMSQPYSKPNWRSPSWKLASNPLSSKSSSRKRDLLQQGGHHKLRCTCQRHRLLRRSLHPRRTSCKQQSECHVLRSQRYSSFIVYIFHLSIQVIIITIIHTFPLYCERDTVLHLPAHLLFVYKWDGCKATRLLFLWVLFMDCCYFACCFFCTNFRFFCFCFIIIIVLASYLSFPLSCLLGSQ